MSTGLLAAPRAGYAASIAAVGLAGSRLEMPATPLDRRSWERLVADARYERLTGLLGRAVEDGVLPVTPEQEEEALQVALAGAVRDLLLERCLLWLADLLEPADVPFRVLKGPALAHTVYGDPGLRSFGDIDVLVPADRFDSAHAALVDAGCTRRYPEPRPGYDRRFGKGASYVVPGGHEVDVHRTLVVGPFGMALDPAGLFEHETTFEVGGRRFLGLGQDHQFLNACLHAALGNVRPRLASLRDVAQLLLHGRVDESQVLAIAAGWRVEAVVAAAVTSSWTALDLADKVPLSTWASRYTPARRETEQLVRYTGETRNTVAQTIAGLREVPGVRGKAAYLHAVLLPQRTAQGDGTIRRWARGLRALRAKDGPG